MHAARATGVFLLSAVGVVAACSEFHTASSDAADGGAGDAAVLVPAPDAGTPAVDGTLPPLPASCPPPSPPPCVLDGCIPVTLYQPAGTEYPFAVATDHDAVYWVAQPSTSTADARNGQASALVARIGKSGGTTRTVLATGEPLATTLALEGDYAYWATFDTTARLRRVRRDCSDECAATTVTMLGASKITALVRVRAGQLAAASEDGSVVLVDTRTLVTARLGQTSPLPALAATDVDLFAAGPQTAKVSHLENGTLVGLAEIPAAPPGSSAGLFPIASDCTAVFGSRSLSPNGPIELLRVDAQGATSLGSTSTPLTLGALVVDATFLYAADTSLGVRIVSKAGGEDLLTVGSGPAWGLASDADGVYFGDHSSVGGGGIFAIKR